MEESNPKKVISIILLILGVLFLFLVYRGIWNIIHDACGLGLFIGSIELFFAVIAIVAGLIIWKKNL
jgi:hypothetical protein